MPGVYEDMADFAAMSEDEGFLGQCAGDVVELASPEPQPLSAVQPLSRSRGPRQLQLLVIPKPATEGGI